MYRLVRQEGATSFLFFYSDFLVLNKIWEGALRAVSTDPTFMADLFSSFDLICDISTIESTLDSAQIFKNVKKKVS